MALSGDLDSITLYRPSQAQVLEQLGAWGTRGSVSPTVNGITVVHADGWFEYSGNASLDERLSVALACVVMRAMVRDEAVLCYWLYQGGVLRDEYDSFPGYVDGETPPEPIGGNAERLCEAFNAKQAMDTIHHILRADWYEGGAHERHFALIEALRLPVELFGPEAIDNAGFVKIDSNRIRGEEEIPSPW